MSEQKRLVRGKVGEGEAELAVRKPSYAERQEAQRVYNLAFRNAVKPPGGGKGAILRETAEELIKSDGLWSDEKEKEAEKIRQEIAAGLKQLREGGMKKSVGRATALKVRDDRARFSDLRAAVNALDAQTAQAQAEQARFDFFVARCSVDPEKGLPRWESVEEYMEDDSELAAKAAGAMSQLLYGIDADFEEKLPENLWLVKHGYAKVVGGHVRLVNDAGHLIDRDGRLVDPDWNYVNPAGKRVNRDGDLLDEKGQVIADEKPLLDD